MANGSSPHDHQRLVISGLVLAVSVGGEGRGGEGEGRGGGGEGR